MANFYSDNEDFQFRIILTHQALQAIADPRLFVSGRHNDRNLGGVFFLQGIMAGSYPRDGLNHPDHPGKGREKEKQWN